MPPKGKGKAGAKVEEIIHTGETPSFSGMVVELKPQISAPSYLNSLAANDLPPFRIPAKEPRPHLLAGPFPLVSEQDIIEIVAASDEDPANGMRKFLFQFVVKKGLVENFAITERNFLVSFLMETIDYAAQRDFNELKLSMLITMYMTTHLYFKWYYWSPPAAIWNYFQDLMIRHTIETTPDGFDYFSPNDCYDIVTHFHTMYVSNLPLIHILTFGAHRLKFTWPFKVVK